ncbi:unnamed protein product [Orchesella dallaii]|uniref:Uncharacterized protein n=1 Tax=Orchesella dallaii TaxID=48710 RepID=A0ABP1PV72_9HEXA
MVHFRRLSCINYVLPFDYYPEPEPGPPLIFPGSVYHYPAKQPRVDPVFPPRGQRPGVGIYRSNSLDDIPKTKPDTDIDALRCSGICVQPRECSRLGGLPKSICPNGGGRVCCHFEESCSETTSEIEASFQSPGFPGPTVGNIVCQYDIHLQAGVCAVRLEFVEFNTTRPLDRGICNIDQFIIMNSLDGAAFPRCGELTGYSTLVAVNPRHRIPLSLLSIIQSSREQYKWNIKITQMRCANVNYVKDTPNCGKKWGDIDAETLPTTTLAPELENTIYSAGDGYMDISRVAVDTAFYIDYLKQAHQALSNSSSNTTTCRNRAGDIQKEKLQEQRSEIEDLLDIGDNDKARILRGTDASLHQFPWQVSIQDAKGHVCGGAIISPDAIVTASHCFLSIAPVPLRTVKIVVGDLNINTTDEAEHTFVNISSVTFHSHFDPYYLENDIAVIKLRNALKFRAGVQPVCLPESGNSYSSQKATVSGWGAISYPQGKLATNLQFVNNTVIENSACKKTLKIDYITQNMMCAVSYPNCSGTCFVSSRYRQITSFICII